MDGWRLVGEVIAFVVLLVLLAVCAGVGVLVIRVLRAVFLGPRRPAPPRRPSPPDDWDDEEYISRHHH